MKKYIQLIAIALIPISIVNIAVAGYFLFVFQPKQLAAEQEAEQLFDEAQRLCEQTNYQGAILKYLKVVEKHPDSVKYPLSLFHIGSIYLENLGEIPRARYSYEMLRLKFAEDENLPAVSRRLAQLERLARPPAAGQARVVREARRPVRRERQRGEG